MKEVTLIQKLLEELNKCLQFSDIVSVVKYIKTYLVYNILSPLNCCMY